MTARRQEPAGRRPLRAGSMCSGYGGLDLAVLAVLDARLAWCVDPDKHAARVLAAHFPDVPNLGDLRAVDWAAVPPVDLVTAGFPCQDISTAGQGAGITEGTRSGLWTCIAEALRQLRPPFVVVENVAALRSRGLGRVLGDLAEMGYDTQWASLRASDIGAAHRRERVFVLAVQPGAVPRLLAAAHPVAGNFNDTESLASWQARRARQKALGRNGNGAGTPLSVAVRVLPTPAAGDAAGGCDPTTRPGGVRPSGAKKQVHLAAVAAWHLAPPPGDTGGEHLLPTPTVVMTWRTPGGHLAWRHAHGRAMPCDLQAAVRLLPTPDTGTSPRGHGRRGGRPGNGHQSGQSLDALAPALHPQPSPTPPAVAWGPYEAAVRRWEHLLGCPTPSPVEPGKNGRPRLAAAFAEWLMGIPRWVTGVEGLPRTAQLRLIGNGVVPQQGAAALQMLLSIAAGSPATARPGDDGQRAAA